MTANSTTEPQVSGSPYRNVTLLAICQGLYVCITTLTVATTPLAGYALLGADKTLATIPFFFYHAGIVITTVPASFLMARIGRRAGFSLGTLLGAASGLLSTAAIFQHDFIWLCFGMTLMGCSAGFAVYYRFAAADAADEAFRPKAISLVMAGGVLAGFLGPQTAKYAVDWFAPIMFAGVYVMVIVYSLAGFLFVQGLKIPPLTVRERRTGGRPMHVIARQPAYIVAVMSSVAGYGVMVVVMSATPLAMLACGFDFNASATVLQAHVIGMFLPSFFTGFWIARFSALGIIAVGAVMQIACAVINASGIDFMNFFIANILVGVGWNFMYIGGSSLLTQTYRPSERAKVQASHDFMVYCVTATAAGLSGVLQAQAGWVALNITALSMTVSVVLGALLLIRYQTRTLSASDRAMKIQH